VEALVDVRMELRALRRAELLLARVREDCGPTLRTIQTIEPLLTRLDRVVEDGGRPEMVDIEGLASAGQMLESVKLTRGHDAIRRDLAAELREIADRLRPVAAAGARRSRPRNAG
jgi:hypothetical protein